MFGHFWGTPRSVDYLDEKQFAILKAHERAFDLYVNSFLSKTQLYLLAAISLLYSPVREREREFYLFVDFRIRIKIRAEKFLYGRLGP